MSYMYKENLNRFDLSDFDGKEYINTIRDIEEPRNMYVSDRAWITGIIGGVTFGIITTIAVYSLIRML